MWIAVPARSPSARGNNYIALGELMMAVGKKRFDMLLDGLANIGLGFLDCLAVAETTRKGGTISSLHLPPLFPPRSQK